METIPMNWHTRSEEESLLEFKTNKESGLDFSEAESRMTTRYGPNELEDKGGLSPFDILWEQLTATMVLILLGSAIMAAVLGDTKNAVAIFGIVILYAVLGFIQEYRAEKAIASLKRMSSPSVRVKRNGQFTVISSRLLVPGDIVDLEAGNIIPADLRLVDAVNLRIQEAVLTGESEPVEKDTRVLTVEDLPLGDRKNLAYMGTLITQGRGLGLVVATGMQTELGKIAGLIQASGPSLTPLQLRLNRLGIQLAVLGGGIALLVFILGIIRGDEIRHMLLTAISVAVAIIPEGLPAVVTITLALGAQRMLRRKALIRKLPAMETLGSVTVICSDKTGTLTENRMTVVVLDAAGHEMDLTENMKGDSVCAYENEGIPAVSPLSLLVTGGALCNDARLVDEGRGLCHTLGDPTEGALVAVAAQMGYRKNDMENEFPRVLELPFDSERKRMTTFHLLSGNAFEQFSGLSTESNACIAFTKGSPDGLLEISSFVRTTKGTEVMSPEWKEKILSANERFARKGMRVMGVAYRLWEKHPGTADHGMEKNLVFTGLFGMIDPPRPEVRDAIRLAGTAGIRTVMITGDHPLTAAEIARQLGISERGKVMTGAELDRIAEGTLREAVGEVDVFARVSPEHKLKIIRAFQENGHIVSMTGDGVNDAPALRKADIGVAMGITGTDVSKDASDLVLLDDNFNTIVAAVEEGRTIYENIRKFVRFSVAGNLGKVMVMLLAPFLGKPIPLQPLQLLWLNLLTDGLLGLGMGVEPSEKGSMQKPPYSSKEDVFSRGGRNQTLLIGLVIGLGVLGVGSWAYFSGRPGWQTLVFTSLALAQVGQALAARSNHVSFFQQGLKSNPLMTFMVVLVLILQLMVIYLAPLQIFFGTTPLTWDELGIAFSMGILVFGIIEIQKKFYVRKDEID